MPNKNKIRNFRKFIEQLAETVDDATALEHPEAFHLWNVGVSYLKDERVRYKDALFKVLQNHISQADWTPDIAVSLYVHVSAEGYPQWGTVRPGFRGPAECVHFQCFHPG